MKKLKLIASYSIMTWASIAFGHESHGQNTAAVVREQKPWGIAGHAKAVRRTLTITMTDQMRFSPDHFTVRQGETIKLVIDNRGKMLHELVIGTQAELDKHAELMLKFPNMEHSEPYMAHVPPGQKGQMIWTFNRAGQFDFACLIAGHYTAGMRGTIAVTP
jgi:uncharacterized cupredoxin-like copper-binding protein